MCHNITLHKVNEMTQTCLQDANISGGFFTFVFVALRFDTKDGHDHDDDDDGGGCQGDQEPRFAVKGLCL